MRRTVICVIGSGSQGWPDLAEPLGRLLASRGVHLLTGGGQGVMQTVSNAFHDTSPRSGLVIGVVPGSVDQEFTYTSKPGYPNPSVEIVIRTHLPLSGTRGTDTLSRNHINILSADAVVALPGRAGTISEADLALRYGKPTLLFGPPDAFAGFPASIERTVQLDRVANFIATSSAN